MTNQQLSVTYLYFSFGGFYAKANLGYAKKVNV